MSKVLAVSSGLGVLVLALIAADSSIAQTSIAVQIQQPVPITAITPGYVVAGKRVYPYPYPYNPRRAYRQAVRYGYVPLVPALPPSPRAVYPRVPLNTAVVPNQTVPQSPTPAAPQPALEPIPSSADIPGPKEF